MEYGIIYSLQLHFAYLYFLKGKVSYMLALRLTAVPGRFLTLQTSGATRHKSLTSSILTEAGITELLILRTLNWNHTSSLTMESGLRIVKNTCPTLRNERNMLENVVTNHKSRNGGRRACRRVGFLAIRQVDPDCSNIRQMGSNFVPTTKCLPFWRISIFWTTLWLSSRFAPS